jgi:CheY-like chemotaxis protein
MKRILVCDDEPHIVEGLRYLLRSPDRTVVIARSGPEALAEVARQAPDLVILDVMMPQMSGLEVVAELRASQETSRLPVIILTAKGEAQDASMAQEVWHATVMAKPFEPQKLRELVDNCLESN